MYIGYKYIYAGSPARCRLVGIYRWGTKDARGTIFSHRGLGYSMGFRWIDGYSGVRFFLLFFSLREDVAD